MVIRYSYLWHRESMKGQEEGTKDRPCAIIVAAKDGRVAALPITHTPPSPDTAALEVPATLKNQLGLDGDRSWIVADEANVFRWPGPDVRRARADSWVYGQLPPNFTKTVLEGVREQRERMKSVSRDAPLPPKDWNNPRTTSGPRKPAPKRDRDPER